MTCKNAVIQVQIQRPNGHPFKKVFLLWVLILAGYVVSGQTRKQIWTDSVFQTMSLPEKIGQLIMMPVAIGQNKESVDDLIDQIKSYHIGGVIITKAGPKGVVSLSGRIQNLTKIPLLVGTNGDSSLDSMTIFLNPLALGAIQNDSMIFKVAQNIGKEMNLIGVNLNFSPQTGLYRSGGDYRQFFGDSESRVLRKSVFLLKGLQTQGIISCVRQFTPTLKKADGKDSIVYFQPGRVDTSLFRIQLGLIQNNINGFVTSDFNFLVAEGKKSAAAGVSSAFINETLKQKIGFEGLAFADIPTLLKISGKKKKGETEMLALSAGNDVLMSPENPGTVIKVIQKALKKNPALLNQLNNSVKRILSTKYDAGLSVKRTLDTDNLLSKLNSSKDKLFKHQLAEAAVTVARNTFSVVPVRTLEDKKFASLSVGAAAENEFNHYLGKYTGFENFVVRQIADTVGLFGKLQQFDVIVVGLFPEASGFQDHLIPMLQRLSAKKQVVISDFGDPFALKGFVGFPTTLVACSDDPLVQQITAQIIFGGLGSRGELPVTIAPLLKEGQSLNTSLADRLSYTVPEAAGMDSKTLEQIVAIAQEAIDMKATPGVQVLVAKNGKVVYEKSVGFLTYDKKSQVTDQTIYDLASVTKVSATLQTVMFMYEKGLIDINKKVSVYLPELRNSNKKDFTIKDILTHQAGLWPFLPFWAQTVKDTVQLPQYYSKKGSPEYPYPVSANLYASRSMKDSLWQWIIKAKVQEKNNHVPYDYKYSDMGFYIFQHLAEKMLNQPMEEFLDQNFYEVLGASTTGYLPLLKFPASRIAPTENDKLFRRSLLVGYVHDQGAAMHGGIAGHAGLFSTINDLAKLGQMWLQKGTYGGHKFFKPETIEFFTQKQYALSRRGLGWDKPTVSDPNGPTSAYASPKTFGHTGFTGISIWVDPDFDLVFIFFSNRVYPDMTNNKILNANIRPRVQDVVYRSIFKYCENHP